jgi:hypothetical protein
MSKNLITLAEYKAYASINSPTHDAEIQGLIPKVSALVKNYCNRTFVDYVDDPKLQQDSGGYTQIFLSEYPVLRVLDVEQSTNYGQTYTSLTEFKDWILDTRQGCIVSLNPQGWPLSLNGYQVKYLAGFEQVPEDLKLAVMDMVTYYRKNDMAVHSSKAPGTNSVQIEYVTTTSLPSHIRRILDLYRSDFA